jgi:hypothetical protein
LRTAGITLIFLILTVFYTVMPGTTAAQELAVRAFATYKLTAAYGDCGEGNITKNGHVLNGTFSVSVTGKNVKGIFNGETQTAPSFSIHAGGRGVYIYGKGAPKRLYRGPLTFSVDSKGFLKIINKVQVEEYLPGVLTGEIGDLKQKEAYKAQAVTARTYTLTLKNNHIKEGYNLCDSPHCQVYYGAENIKPKAAEAVAILRRLQKYGAATDQNLIWFPCVMETIHENPTVQ